MSPGGLTLLRKFCRKYHIGNPEPDENERYLFGFDRVEISVFEDLGVLYASAEVATLSGGQGNLAEDRRDDNLIKLVAGYLFNFLYEDECILNCQSRSGESALMLVTSFKSSETDLEFFEYYLNNLVTRVESLHRYLATPHKAESSGSIAAVIKP